MKKFKFLVVAVALFAVVAVNVWNAATSLKSSALNIEDVEAIAQDIEAQEEMIRRIRQTEPLPAWWTEVRHEYDQRKATCTHYEECRFFESFTYPCDDPGAERSWSVYVGSL